VWCGLAGLLLSPGVAAQQEGEGVNRGNYNIRQVFEVGGRITEQSGNRAIFDTLVHLRSGPRLLEHQLEMRSLNHAGTLFDNFSVHSFGYGGDPDSVTRLRAYKNKWYNFSGTFRRDYNYWDYNLLANPLNPATAVANAPAGFSPVILQSPHRTQLVRRMSDFNLTLLPQSRFRVRLGYGRNVVEGPSYTTFHEGTDIELFQPWKTTQNTYSAGFDFKFLPRTSFSFDQFFHHYKGDTQWRDVNQTFALSSGTPVDLGLIFNTSASQPCATPFNAAPLGSVNPICNGYFTYSATTPVRSNMPTSQISLQSNYFERFDFAGKFAYSSGDNDYVFDELATGLVSRTRQRQFDISGPGESRRVAATADFAGTFYVTAKLRFQDTFHFANYRLPGQWSMVECSFFNTSLALAPTIFTTVTNPIASCIAPANGAAGTPSHTTSSPADIIIGNFSSLLREDSKTNTFEVAYDFSKRWGARLGYRYRAREVVIRENESEDLHFFPSLPNRGACAGIALQADGTCRVTTVASLNEMQPINEHSGLLSLWGRPDEQFRFSFDLELLYADHALTRISPRQMQRYKWRATYKPAPWATLAGSVNIIEARNNVLQINHKRHNRSYSFNVMLEPDEKWSLDAGFDYTDIKSLTDICYTLGSGPLPPGSTACPIIGANAPIFGVSEYTNTADFWHVNLMLHPVKRVTAHLRYVQSNADGDTTFLNPTAPLGPLDTNYRRPSFDVLVDCAKGVGFKFGWDYWNYREAAQSDPFLTGPRDFHAHVVTLALRFSF
jgi:hypothetical protein